MELVKAGLAWHYKQYSKDPVLAEAEVEARRGKAGLWSMPGAVPPWEWRRGRRGPLEAQLDHERMWSLNRLEYDILSVVDVMWRRFWGCFFKCEEGVF